MINVVYFIDQLGSDKSFREATNSTTTDSITTEKVKHIIANEAAITNKTVQKDRSLTTTNIPDLLDFSVDNNNKHNNTMKNSPTNYKPFSNTNIVSGTVSGSASASTTDLLSMSTIISFDDDDNTNNPNNSNNGNSNNDKEFIEQWNKDLNEIEDRFRSVTQSKQINFDENTDYILRTMRESNIGDTSWFMTRDFFTSQRSNYRRLFVTADKVYCSPLTRAIETAFVALEEHKAMSNPSLILYRLVLFIYNVC